MKITLDPGHGGRDPGAVGNGLQEKNLTLTIARSIRSILQTEYTGYELRMTRDADTYLSLSERASMANAWNADYFLSIHVNAGGGTGFESFIHPSRNARTVSYQQRIHSSIIQELSGVRDRGMKEANFAVLRETRMPALLTENLFIDHAQDAQLLRTSSFLTQIARAHVAGLAAAFQLRRSSSSGGSNQPPDPAPGELYRVIVDGTQVGAFEQRENILRQVETNLGTANRIVIERV